MLLAGIIAAAIPSITPDPNGVLGGNQLANLVGGVMFYALMALTLGFMLGAGSWWAGSQSQNAGTVQLGRRAVTGAVIGVLLIGAAVAILNWGFSFGASVTP